MSNSARVILQSEGETSAATVSWTRFWAEGGFKTKAGELCDDLRVWIL